MAASGSTVHVATGAGQVFYHRSSDEGQDWAPPVPIGSGTVYLDRPLYADGPNVYLAYFKTVQKVTDWCCERDLGDIYLRRSTDDGKTWWPEIRLTSSGGAYRVALAAQGSDVYVTWMDYRGDMWDIYLRRSADGGASWLPEQKIASGSSPFGAERPDILVRGKSIFVAYNDDLGVQNCLPEVYKQICSEVYLLRSRDGGEIWDPAVRVTYNNAWSGRPMLAPLPEGLIVGWEQTISNTDRRNHIWVNRSKDDGQTWERPQELSSMPASHEWIAARDRQVWVAWHDTGNKPNQKIVLRESTDGGATWGPEVNISTRPGESSVPVLGLTSHYIHVVLYDNGNPAYARRLISVPRPRRRSSLLLRRRPLYGDDD